MRSGTRGERLRLGGLDWSPARRTQQSCPPRTRAAPGSTNHRHRCWWDNAAHSRQAVELPGRAGAEPEAAAPPPGCSAPRSSTIHSLQNGKHVSPRHRKRQALSVRVPARRSCLRSWHAAAAREGQLCPRRRKGTQMCLPPLAGTAGATSRGYHEISVLWISCCSEAAIPGGLGGFWARPCSIMFQQNLTLQKNKGIVQKYLSSPHVETRKLYFSIQRCWYGHWNHKSFYFAKRRN